MAWLEPITLRGKYAALAPLSQRHHDGVVAAAKDGELWHLWYTTVPAPEKMAAEIERRLKQQEAGAMLPFVVVENASGAPVGMTNFLNADGANRRLEIGATWYAKRVQRTAINTECKLALLTHAFERLDRIAVEFRTHVFNHQSAAASSGSAPSSTAFCATTRFRRTERIAIRAFTASSPTNGRR